MTHISKSHHRKMIASALSSLTTQIAFAQAAIAVHRKYSGTSEMKKQLNDIHNLLAVAYNNADKAYEEFVKEN